MSQDTEIIDTMDTAIDSFISLTRAIYKRIDATTAVGQSQSQGLQSNASSSKNKSDPSDESMRFGGGEDEAEV